MEHLHEDLQSVLQTNPKTISINPKTLVDFQFLQQTTLDSESDSASDSSGDWKSAYKLAVLIEFRERFGTNE